MNENLIISLVIVSGLAWGIASAAVARRLGGTQGAWFLVGAILGPIGFAWSFCCGSACPTCRSIIHRQAKVCPRCTADTGFASDPAPAPLTAKSQSF
jgi:hypothetical protein